MWVRNQKRNELIKVDRFEVDRNFICAVSMEGNDQLVNLGEYESEDRALEVLDNIQAQLNNYDWSISHAHFVTRVFEMPEY